MLEVGTDTKRNNYTPNIKSLELVEMNPCSMSICSVFYQWVGGDLPVFCAGKIVFSCPPLAKFSAKP